MSASRISKQEKRTMADVRSHGIPVESRAGFGVLRPGIEIVESEEDPVTDLPNE